jgi:DNA-binding NarL/FixJ family response regulator
MQAQAGTGNTPIQAVVADRCPHFRETLRRVLQQDSRISIAGEAATLRDALRLVRKSGAQLVLLDIQLVMGQPAPRLRRIAGGLPDLNVIILLDEDLPGYRRAIAERWGYTCLAKESAASELMPALAS